MREPVMNPTPTHIYTHTKYIFLNHCRCISRHYCLNRLMYKQFAVGKKESNFDLSDDYFIKRPIGYIAHLGRNVKCRANLAIL